MSITVSRAPCCPSSCKQGAGEAKPSPAATAAQQAVAHAALEQLEVPQAASTAVPLSRCQAPQQAGGVVRQRRLCAHLHQARHALLQIVGAALHHRRRLQQEHGGKHVAVGSQLLPQHRLRGHTHISLWAAGQAGPPKSRLRDTMGTQARKH